MHLDDVIAMTNHINDVFESMYISRSMLVCGATSTMYYMYALLSKLDYPVDVLTVHNAQRVLDRFLAHKVRMIIVHHTYIPLFETYLKSVWSLLDVCFVDAVGCGAGDGGGGGFGPNLTLVKDGENRMFEI